MSRKKPWWNYVKSIIREYPALKKEIETPLATRITPVYGSIGGGSGISDPVTNAVIHDLPKPKQRKFDAVENAIIETKAHYDNWKIRLDIIDMVYWRKTHTIQGASMATYCHYNTACTYQADFINAVSRYLDLP